MPKSKRNKQVELSKVKKQGVERKKKLYEEIRSCADKYEQIFVFSVSDMRNSKMKTVREEWKHSRFFIGKNRVMAMALGRSLEEEYLPNLHKVGKLLKGQCGLLFSNQPMDEVLSWFRSYSEGDFARSGNIATEDVVLKEGPLSQFPHNLEPELRRLGLPTSLQKGIVHLIKDHQVCKVGDVLTSEAAKILEHLGYEMAEFHITILCAWSRDGNFMDLRTNIPSPDSKKKKKRESLEVNVNGKGSEKMEVDVESESSDDASVDAEEAEALGAFEESKDAKSCIASTEEGKENVLHLKSVQSESNVAGENQPLELSNNKEILNCSSTPKESSVTQEEKSSKARKRKIVKKELDLANSSQDSPVFRELRNRSVKVSKRRNK